MPFDESKPVVCLVLKSILLDNCALYRGLIMTYFYINLETWKINLKKTKGGYHQII